MVCSYSTNSIENRTFTSSQNILLDRTVENWTCPPSSVPQSDREISAGDRRAYLEGEKKTLAYVSIVDGFSIGPPSSLNKSVHHQCSPGDPCPPLIGSEKVIPAKYFRIDRGAASPWKRDFEGSHASSRHLGISTLMLRLLVFLQRHIGVR